MLTIFIALGPDWIFFKGLGNNFSAKSCPNIWQLFGLVLKHQFVIKNFIFFTKTFLDLNFDPASPDVSQNVLKQFSYGKLVLKESLRMFPVSVGVGRVLPVDVVFSGFRVPKGTIVVTQNQVSLFFLKSGPFSASFSLFSSCQTNVTIFTTNICDKMSIQYLWYMKTHRCLESPIKRDKIIKSSIDSR